MNTKTVLSIDIETYSDNDLIKGGVYKYVDSPKFEILLFGYAFNDEKVTVIDLKNGEKLPKKVINALMDTSITKTAYNSNFEIVCITKYFGINVPISSFVCTIGGLILGYLVGLRMFLGCLD